MCSGNLQRIEVRDMGRYFDGMEMMLVYNHDRGSSPKVIDLWKTTLRAGANSLAASCNIFAGTSSSPVDLYIFNSCSNLAIPFVVMIMTGIPSMFENGYFGKLVLFVKSNLN